MFIYFQQVQVANALNKKHTIIISTTFLNVQVLVFSPQFKLAKAQTICPVIPDRFFSKLRIIQGQFKEKKN
jgi:hypothetical protein